MEGVSNSCCAVTAVERGKKEEKKKNRCHLGFLGGFLGKAEALENATRFYLYARISGWQRGNAHSTPRFR